MKINIWLVVIVIFALILRIVDISNNPPALYGDELTIVLDANSILKTGKDQLGNPPPLTFSMGAGRPAGYVYGSIPFIAVFGPSALGVRGLSILSGIGTIILLYYIGRKLFSKKLGLAAAFVMSVSPWDISLSRGGFESHFALFLAVLGFYLYVLAKEKPLLYIFAALSFGLTIHTYPTYKVILPLFLILIIWFEATWKFVISSKKHFLGGLIILLILGLLSISQTFIGDSEKRFSSINVFSKDEVKDVIEQKVNFERNLTNLPKSIAKYFHNKPVEYSKILIENYLQNFSLDFLLLHGDRNPRHNMATMGVLYFAQGILIFIGILTFWQKQKKTIGFLIIWLLIAPIPTAFVDNPHALRSSFMLPPLILLASLGLNAVLSSNRKILYYIFGLLFIIQFVFFSYKLYFLAPKEYSNFWSYPAKGASDFVQKEKEKFEYVILSDRIDNIEFAYPVYARIDPKVVISQNKEKYDLLDYSFKKFDNVYIGSIPDGEVDKFLQNLNSSVLYIGPKEDGGLIQGYEVLHNLDGLPALVIWKQGIK